jgi:hypothetical protein
LVNLTALICSIQSTASLLLSLSRHFSERCFYTRVSFIHRETFVKTIISAKTIGESALLLSSPPEHPLFSPYPAFCDLFNPSHTRILFVPDAVAGPVPCPTEPTKQARLPISSTDII